MLWSLHTLTTSWCRLPQSSVLHTVVVVPVPPRPFLHTVLVAEVERLPCALSTFLLDSVVLANSVSPTLVNPPAKRAAEHPCWLLENSSVSPDGSLLTIRYLATLPSLPS